MASNGDAYASSKALFATLKSIIANHLPNYLVELAACIHGLGTASNAATDIMKNPPQAVLRDVASIKVVNLIDGVWSNFTELESFMKCRSAYFLLLLKKH